MQYRRVLTAGLVATLALAPGCFLFENDTDAGGSDAGPEECPPGLDFVGECDGTVVRWCDMGVLHEDECAVEPDLGECFELNSTFGNTCGTRDGQPCFFNDGSGGTVVYYCQAPATGCSIGTASACADLGTCTESDVGGCAGQSAIVGCRQGQPTHIECGLLGGRCSPGENCLDMPEGAPCGDLLACAAGLSCVDGTCSSGPPPPPDGGPPPMVDAGPRPDAGVPPPPCVWPGNLTIFNQGSLDAFRDSGCDEVAGMVVLNSTTLTRLVGLERLRVVGGELRLLNCPLTDLRALSNLERVGGLEIVECDALPNLDGLDNLAATVKLTLGGLGSLTNIRGLRGLREVGDEIGESSILIRGNPVLSSLQGLEGITLANYVTVDDCPSLTSLDGLRNLQTVNLVTELTALGVSSVGLSSLRQTRDLLIRDNDSASSISFPALTTVERELMVNSHDVLTSFSFPSLTSLGTGLRVQLNPVLSQCLVDTFHANLVASGFRGTTAFGGNLSCP